MNPFDSVCDDFYINMNLSTEMDLPSNRETILHFFERMQKAYPAMNGFTCRDRGDFILEEEKDQGTHRWCSVEPRRLSSGQVNPETIDQAMDQHRLVLDLAPFSLSVSSLDCEALDLLFGFDFTYRGNHNQLVAEALGLNPAMERLIELPGVTTVNYEPSLTIAFDEVCRIQCRVSVETRTNVHQIRSGDFPEEQLSVYVTARKYGSLSPETSYPQVLERLLKVCQDVVDRHVLDHVLRPLARTIALK